MSFCTGYVRFQTLTGDKILEHETSGQNITLEKNKEEIHKLQYIFKSVDFQHEIDYSNLDCIISELTFQDTVKQIEEKCILMHSLFLEFARAEEERKIKTAAEKLIRIVHAQSCLIHIGGQSPSQVPSTSHPMPERTMPALNVPALTMPAVPSTSVTATESTAPSSTSTQSTVQSDSSSSKYSTSAL